MKAIDEESERSTIGSTAKRRSRPPAATMRSVRAEVARICRQVPPGPTVRQLPRRWPATSRPLWDWIGQWNEAVQAIGRQNSTQVRPQDGGGPAASKLRKMLDDRPGHPDADAFKQRLPYLDAIVHADRWRGQSDRGGAQTRFHRSPRGRRMDADGYGGRAEVLFAGRSRIKARTAESHYGQVPRTALNTLPVSIFPRSKNRFVAMTSALAGALLRNVRPQRHWPRSWRGRPTNSGSFRSAA